MNNASVHAKPRLSSEEVEQYRREGYLIYKQPVFPESEFKALQDHFEKLLAAWPRDIRPEMMDVPHFVDTELFRWALSDAVLDLVEPILGPDILLFSTHFICKPKGDGRRVPWHEDSTYWKGNIDPMNVATVWVAIDPSTGENGCMKVIPRTHNTGRKGYSDYADVDKALNVFTTEVVKEQRRDEQAVPCILQPNECSIHDGRLMHGSEPNTSTMRRCGWTLRYASADVKMAEDRLGLHNMYLARGKNLTGQPLADPGRSYPEILEKRTNTKFKLH